MKADDIPVATVAVHQPAVAAASSSSMPAGSSAQPPPLPVAPVTPEEAAAIARRIRVEARLPRVTLVGTVLGLVCGVAAVWPFLDSNGYMADVLVQDELGVFAFAPGWLLGGLLPLLAFYAGRLHFQTGRSSTGEIEADLRKIRRVILASMFASVLAFVFVLAQGDGRRYYGNLNDDNATPRLTFLYLACFAGCVAIIGDVRRGLGDYDSEHQRRRRKLARGFTVELRGGTVEAEAPIASVAPTQPPDVPPLARPTVLSDGEDTVGQANRGTGEAGPPPLPDAIPVAIPVARAVPVAPLAVAEEDEHFKDLRLLMTVAILVGVLLHACRIGEGMRAAMNAGEYVTLTGPSVLSGGGGFGSSAVATPLAALVALAALAAVVLLIPCGLAWIVWGLSALNYGPSLRRTIGWLAVLTLLLSVLAVGPAWLFGTTGDELFMSGRSSRSYVLPNRLGRGPEIIHCLLIGLLLTRPGVRRLFARSSDSDDGDENVGTRGEA